MSSRTRLLLGMGLGILLLFTNGQVGFGQARLPSITLVNGGYVPPGTAAVGTFNAGGTWQMGAGQTFSKVFVEMEEQLAGQQNWVPINGQNITVTKDLPTRTYAVSVTYTAVAGAKYRMKATLFRTGNGGAVSVAVSPVGGWLDITP